MTTQRSIVIETWSVLSLVILPKVITKTGFHSNYREGPVCKFMVKLIKKIDGKKVTHYEGQLYLQLKYRFEYLNTKTAHMRIV